MNAFPNSRNVSFTLFRVKTTADALGNQAWRLVGSKEVCGVISSITSKEYYTSLQSSAKLDFKIAVQCFVYDGSRFALVAGKAYEIKRTYLNGTLLELYLEEAPFGWEEVTKDGS